MFRPMKPVVRFLRAVWGGVCHGAQRYREMRFESRVEDAIQLCRLNEFCKEELGAPLFGDALIEGKRIGECRHICVVPEEYKVRENRDKEAVRIYKETGQTLFTWAGEPSTHST